MNADVIDEQAEGWVISAFFERPHQTIFEMPYRNLPTAAEPLDASGTGPSSPGQEGIRTLVRAGPSANNELRRGEQRSQCSMGQHPSFRNPESPPLETGHLIRRE